MLRRSCRGVLGVVVLALGLTFFAQASPARAKIILVDSIDALNDAVPRATPGDEVVLKDGTYRDAELRIHGKGKEGAPLLVRAETVGGVKLTGESNLRLWGSFVTVQGLSFEDGHPGGTDVVQFRRNDQDYATDCRLTRCSIVGFNPPDGSSGKWVSLFGKRNRIDHCYIAGKTTEGTTLVVWLDGEPNHHRIDHNHFGFRPDLGRNGGETIRIGTSQMSLSSSATIVEYNLFDECDGEIEVISSKSCDNIYRGNTFDNCAGMLTLRHGDRCLVENNVFIGRGKRGGGGVRVIGAGHVVRGNHMQTLTGTDDFRTAMSIMNTQPNNALNGYALVEDAVVTGNVVVDCNHPLTIGTGAGKRNRTLPPKNLTLSGNYFLNPNVPSEYLILDEPEGMTAEWNVVVGGEPPAMINAAMLTHVDIKRGAEGLMVPTGAAGLAEAGYALDYLQPTMSGHWRSRLLIRVRLGSPMKPTRFSTAKIDQLLNTVCVRNADALVFRSGRVPNLYMNGKPKPVADFYLELNEEEDVGYDPGPSYPNVSWKSWKLPDARAVLLTMGRLPGLR